MINLENCKSLNDIARQEFGKADSNQREKVKKLLDKEGIDWKQWLKDKGNIVKEVNKRYCLKCGKELLSSQDKYCSLKCRLDKEHEQYIDRWKQGLEDGLKGEYQLSNHIRRYLFETRGCKCEICGWNKINSSTNTIPVEIHHKDGNYLNNTEENLQILCPNCHSLTETYKSHNQEGRIGRKKYYHNSEE